MQGSVKASLLLVSLLVSGCATVFVYEGRECKVLERRENGKLILECYDKSLRKESRSEPKETK
jgi:hypothetical protein